jgi:hypothetical protein
MFRLPLSSLLIVLAAAAPCAAQPDARYLVPKDVLVVDVTVTTQTNKQLVEGNGIVAPVAATTVKREGTATLLAVGDTNQVVNVHLKNSGLSDTSFALEFAPNGLLTSINASSKGRLGEILGSVFKFAGTVLSVISPGFAGGVPCDRPAPAAPLDLRYFVQQNPQGCDAWKALGEAETRLENAVQALAALQDQIVTPATRPSDLAARITLQRAAVKDAQLHLASRQDALAKSLEAFLKSQSIGPGTPVSARTRVILELDELPRDGAITEGMDDAAAQAALTATKSMANLYKSTGVVATLGTSGHERLPAPLPDDASGKTVTVCHRPTTPLRLRLFVKVKREGKETLQQTVDSIENVLHPFVPSACTSFKASSLGERKLALTMDDKGRLKRVERSGTSDVAALTASLSVAAAALRDEYAASLKKLEEVQTSSRNLKLGDLTTEADRLKKEKAVLDAKLDLDAGSANYDAVLSQRRLAADLAALQADVNLANAEDTREQRLEIERLKADIELMQKTMDLMRAEQELLKLRKD